MKIYKDKNVDADFYTNKLQKSLSSYVKVIEFIFIDLEKLKVLGQIDLLLTLLKRIAGYLNELKDIGMYDEYDVMLSMVGHLICNLINMGHVGKV